MDGKRANDTYLVLASERVCVARTIILSRPRIPRSTTNQERARYFLGVGGKGLSSLAIALLRFC